SSTNNSGKKLSVMIFGSDEFAAGILKKLNYYVSSNESRIVHIEVACPLPKGGNMSERVGKKWVKNNNFTPIHRTASELSYKVHPRSPQSLSGWAIPEPSLGGRFSGNVETIAIVCYSNLILPERLANSFSLGMLHIHPSLLPMHRGQTAIQTAILRGDESTGVTISEYSFRTICGGKILAQIPYKLNRTSKFSEVQQILAQLGGDLMGMVLENLSYLRAHAILQNESQATYTRQYTDDDMKVVWEKMTANDIYRRYRAFYGLMSLHTVWR
ncbi:Formyltransferase, partial [Coemansia reversa NRRL 1564]